MKNEDIAKVVSNKDKETYWAVMKALAQKDEEIKRHEQELLWKFASILNDVGCSDEAYYTAYDDFKKKLINNFD